MNFTSGKSYRRRNPRYAENNKQCRERVRVCNVGLRMTYISSLVACSEIQKYYVTRSPTLVEHSFPHIATTERRYDGKTEKL